ncbi:MAG: cytochrome C [Synechococcus sp. MED850]|jgi:mono/diheme cytochrome c family protein|nr:cytochrome C [Synechococcus sp. MED850]
MDGGLTTILSCTPEAVAEPTSTAVTRSGDDNTDRGRGLIAALVLLAAAACMVLLLWVLGNARQDPYLRATFDLQGSSDHGGQLFRINCAGCHGLAGQGLLGPELIGITDRFKDAQLVHQIVSGETPPMPSFQMEPAAMADLLAYMHTLD